MDELITQRGETMPYRRRHVSRQKYYLLALFLLVVAVFVGAVLYDATDSTTPPDQTPPALAQ
jgi:hypothetical protein